MKWIAILFLAMCVIVPVGFYFQAHTNFRGRSKLEPWAKQTYKEGAEVPVALPVVVCDTRALCAEARRMSRRLHEAKTKNKTKDVAVAEGWFKQIGEHCAWADRVLVLHADPRYTQVRVLQGEKPGFEGFVYTVGLEEDASPLPSPAAP